MALASFLASLVLRLREAVSSPCREPTYFLLLAQEKGKQRERHPASAVPTRCALRARGSGWAFRPGILPGRKGLGILAEPPAGYSTPIHSAPEGNPKINSFTARCASRVVLFGFMARLPCAPALS